MPKGERLAVCVCTHRLKVRSSKTMQRCLRNTKWSMRRTMWCVSWGSYRSFSCDNYTHTQGRD